MRKWWFVLFFTLKKKATVVKLNGKMWIFTFIFFIRGKICTLNSMKFDSLKASNMEGRKPDHHLLSKLVPEAKLVIFIIHRKPAHGTSLWASTEPSIDARPMKLMQARKNMAVLSSSFIHPRQTHATQLTFIIFGQACRAQRAGSTSLGLLLNIGCDQFVGWHCFSTSGLPSWDD